MDAIEGTDLFRRALDIALLKARTTDPSIVDGQGRSAFHEGLERITIYRGLYKCICVRLEGRVPDSGVPKEETIIVSEDVAKSLKCTRAPEEATPTPPEDVQEVRVVLSQREDGTEEFVECEDQCGRSLRLPSKNRGKRREITITRDSFSWRRPCK